MDFPTFKKKTPFVSTRNWQPPIFVYTHTVAAILQQWLLRLAIQVFFSNNAEQSSLLQQQQQQQTSPFKIVLNDLDLDQTWKVFSLSFVLRLFNGYKRCKWSKKKERFYSTPPASLTHLCPFIMWLFCEKKNHYAISQGGERLESILLSSVNFHPLSEIG